MKSDTVVQEDTLVKCIEFLETNENAGTLGIKMFDGKGNFYQNQKEDYLHLA